MRSYRMRKTNIVLRVLHDKHVKHDTLYVRVCMWGVISGVCMITSVYADTRDCDLVRFEASRGAGAQSVTVKPTGCGFDLRSRRWNIYLILYFHFFALVSQHAMPPELGRKWWTECLNTRFPLPTLLCPGYSVKLFFFINK